VELQARHKDLQAQGIGLATISYDSPEIIQAFVKQHGITFLMLSDKGSATIKRYGLLNTVVAELTGPNRDDPAVKAEVERYISVAAPNPAWSGIAFPGTFMLNRQGRVTARFFEDFYIERNTVSSLLKKLGVSGETVAGTNISTEHLELTTYPSDAEIAPGNRFSLVFEITPKRGMHLYAPGAGGYRVISLKLAEQPYVRLLPLTYPRSEIYHFKPLNERVPVYQKPFTLSQEAILEGHPRVFGPLRGQDALTINGTLDYQACDDKLCYNPASLPLSWTVKLRPLVTQRPGAAQAPATRSSSAKPIEYSAEARFQLDVRVPDAALNAYLPPGFAINIATQGAAKDANLRVVFIDRMTINAPDGKPAGATVSNRLVYLVAPVREPGGANAQHVIGGLTEDPADAPGPFGNYIRATTHTMKRSTSSGSGSVIESQDWVFRADSGEHLEMQITFERGVGNKGNPNEVRFYSANNSTAIGIASPVVVNVMEQLLQHDRAVGDRLPHCGR
jgi:peroxiredoxin